MNPSPKLRQEPSIEAINIILEEWEGQETPWSGLSHLHNSATSPVTMAALLHKGLSFLTGAGVAYFGYVYLSDTMVLAVCLCTWNHFRRITGSTTLSLREVKRRVWLRWRCLAEFML